MPCNSDAIRFVVHANMILSAGSFSSSQLIVISEPVCLKARGEAKALSEPYKDKSIPRSIIPYQA
jgi:hypothetical protein